MKVSPLESRTAGVAYAVAAYLSWGLLPLYFKAARQVPPLDMAAYRIILSGLMLAAFLAARGRLGEVARLFTSRALAVHGGAALLLAMNWVLFVWAVDHGRVLEASLGYYICPLMTVSLAVLFLRQRLTPWQGLSVAIAAAGVAPPAPQRRRPPALSLWLARCFP